MTRRLRNVCMLETVQFQSVKLFSSSILMMDKPVSSETSVPSITVNYVTLQDTVIFKLFSVSNDAVTKLRNCLIWENGWTLRNIVHMYLDKQEFFTSFFSWQSNATRTYATPLLKFLDHTHLNIHRTPLNERSARRRGRYLQNKHERRKSVPSLEFEPATPTMEEEATYASDLTSIGIGG